MSKTNWAAIAVIVAILGYIGFFDQPDIRSVRQSENPDSVCPNPLFLNNFEIYFKNIGRKPTDLCVTVNSTNIIFIKTKDCLAISNTNTEPTSFKFRINGTNQDTSNKENSINVKWEYKTWVSVENSIVCNYRNGNLI